MVHVTYGDGAVAGTGTGAFVTHKLTSDNGVMRFGGWAGKAQPTAHSLTVSLVGYADLMASLQVKAQSIVQTTVKLSKEGGEHK